MLVHAVCRVNLDLRQPGRPEVARVLLGGERSGDAAGPLTHVGARRLVHVGVCDYVRHRDAPAGSQHACHLAQDLGLVGGQVDHAVGDDHVHRGVRQRDVLDVALAERDVVHTRLGGVGPGELEHLLSHVQADRPAARSDAARADEHVGARPRSKIEHGLSLAQVIDGRRHAAAQRRAQRARGCAVGIRSGAQGIAEHLST